MRSALLSRFLGLLARNSRRYSLSARSLGRLSGQGFDRQSKRGEDEKRLPKPNLSRLFGSGHVGPLEKRLGSSTQRLLKKHRTGNQSAVVDRETRQVRPMMRRTSLDDLERNLLQSLALTPRP